MKNKQIAKALFAIISILTLLSSCKKIEEFNQAPEIEPLRQGFQASAAIGYCASLATSAFRGEALPSNVTFDPSTRDGYTNAGIIHVQVSDQNPLPFNTGLGDIYIAGLWDTNGGVISIIFADINFFESKFYGLYTVPITRKETGEIITVFAEQDIIIGEGSDTLLDLSLTKAIFTTELERLNNPQPLNQFVAVSQNVWFINIDQNGTASDIYDDNYEINGGGQILSASSNSGGILYHAMIGTKFNYNTCASNPTDGTAFIQNFKASGSSVDLGNITLGFHDSCDGRAKVEIATGKYVTSNGKNIALNF